MLNFWEWAVLTDPRMVERFDSGCLGVQPGKRVPANAPAPAAVACLKKSRRLLFIMDCIQVSNILSSEITILLIKTNLPTNKGYCIK
jgi:hypothetical protein